MSELPTWWPEVEARLRRFAELERGWDSYGGLPVSPRAIERTLALLRAAIGSSTPEPAVVPMANGGVVIEWYDLGIYAEVSPGEVLISRFDSNCKLVEETHDADRLVALLEARP